MITLINYHRVLISSFNLSHNIPMKPEDCCWLVASLAVEKLLACKRVSNHRRSIRLNFITRQAGSRRFSDCFQLLITYVIRYLRKCCAIKLYVYPSTDRINDCWREWTGNVNKLKAYWILIFAHQLCIYWSASNLNICCYGTYRSNNVCIRCWEDGNDAAYILMRNSLP